MMTSHPNNKRLNVKEKPSPKVENGTECDESLDFEKMKVECICPKCGKRHVMNFHWIGRGTPRKYCQFCKGSF